MSRRALSRVLATMSLAAASLTGSAGDARAQRLNSLVDQMSRALGGDGAYYHHPAMNNVDYSGKFILARVWYSGTFAWAGAEGPGWSHDFPQAEENLSNIVKEITTMRLYMDGGNIFKLDDPEMFKFPVAYLSEPGGWFPTASEVDGLRNYLQKGGMIIFDDYRFGGQGSMNDPVMRGFQGMKAVFPKLNPVRLELTDPIFDSFFRITEPTAGLGGVRREEGSEVQFWGIHEDNDPRKRLLAVFDLNEDVGEYWEWSGRGRLPFDMTQSAFKLGVNYLMYAMTH